MCMTLISLKTSTLNRDINVLKFHGAIILLKCKQVGNQAHNCMTIKFSNATLNFSNWKWFAHPNCVKRCNAYGTPYVLKLQMILTVEILKNVFEEKIIEFFCFMWMYYSLWPSHAFSLFLVKSVVLLRIGSQAHN